MSSSRRNFLVTSATSLLGLALPSQAHAASAASARLYASLLPIRDIARGLVLGIGREVWRYVKSLDPSEVQRFTEQFDPNRFQARVRTLEHTIDLEFDSLVLAIDGLPQQQNLGDFVGAIHAIAEEDDNWNLDDNEAKRLKETIGQARQRIREAIDAGKRFELSYNVRYKQAYFHIANQARQGHVRLDLNLLQTVRMFNGAAFAADLTRQGDGTRVYTSLWSDVCIGRREGPLVRRIAEREIRCREATFLAQIEREVQLLVNNPTQSRLSQMIPELIRRIAETEGLN